MGINDGFPLLSLGRHTEQTTIVLARKVSINKTMRRIAAFINRGGLQARGGGAEGKEKGRGGAQEGWGDDL